MVDAPCNGAGEHAKRKPRVLHVITNLAVGGAQNALRSLLASGLAERCDCSVLALTGDCPSEDTPGSGTATVTSLGMHQGLPSFRDLIRLRREVRRVDADVIQGWMYHGNIAAWMGRKCALGKPALAWNVRHSLYDLQREKPMTRQVIRANRSLSGASDAIVYNARTARRQHEEFGFSRAAGVVIPNGFDVAMARPIQTGGAVVRAALGIPESALVIGSGARFHPMKNHDGFVRAAVRVMLAYPEVHVVLMGRDLTRENRALTALVPDRMAHRFHWLGERSDPMDVMREMDVFCVSSAWGEGFPNVLGEAMTVGVPCVATDVGDSAAVVGDTGVVVPGGDDDALAGGLERLVARPGHERRVLGERARERIARKFGLDLAVERYAGLYERLVRRRS